METFENLQLYFQFPYESTEVLIPSLNLKTYVEIYMYVLNFQTVMFELNVTPYGQLANLKEKSRQKLRSVFLTTSLLGKYGACFVMYR